MLAGGAPDATVVVSPAYGAISIPFLCHYYFLSIGKVGIMIHMREH